MMDGWWRPVEGSETLQVHLFCDGEPVCDLTPRPAARMHAWDPKHRNTCEQCRAVFDGKIFAARAYQHLEIDPGEMLAWCGANRDDHDVMPDTADVTCVACLRRAAKDLGESMIDLRRWIKRKYKTVEAPGVAKSRPRHLDAFDHWWQEYQLRNYEFDGPRYRTSVMRDAFNNGGLATLEEMRKRSSEVFQEIIGETSR